MRPREPLMHFVCPRVRNPGNSSSSLPSATRPRSGVVPRTIQIGAFVVFGRWRARNSRYRLCCDRAPREHVFGRWSGVGSTGAVGDVAEKSVEVSFGGGLEVGPDRPGRWRPVSTPQGIRPVAIMLEEAEDRCRLGLALFEGTRVVDVSRDPAAFFNALRNAADQIGEPRERWASAAGSGLDRLGKERSWWKERRAGPDEQIALLAAWPLLRQSELGPAGPTVLPRWAAGLCAGPDLHRAVRRELDRRSSRRVIRLIGERLTGRPAWWPLALVLAMPRLDAGQVGEVLAGFDDDFLCTDDQYALLARVLGNARPDLAIRLLRSASTEASPQRLLQGLDGLARARHVIPRLPITVPSLELCVAETLAPPPLGELRLSRRPANRTARESEPAVAAHPQAVGQQPQTRRVAPTLETWKSTGSFVHPPAWIRLDGLTQGHVQLRLPESPADLNRWGFELNNCLGSYQSSIDEGRSLVLGIFVRGHLDGAVEVDPAKRRIVQISSVKSRPLPKATRQTVTAMLMTRGAVAPA